MASVKVLARDWTIEVSPTVTAPTFTRVGGVNTFTVSSDKNDTDVTDFDSGGYDEHIVTGRSNEVSFEGFYLEDPDTGTRDPGQAIIDTKTEEIGPDAFGVVRITSPGGKVRQYKASFGVGDIGGGNTDATSWGATATPSGPPLVVSP